VRRRFGADRFQFEVVDGWPRQDIKGVAASVACDSRGRAYVGVRNIPPGGGVVLASFRPGAAAAFFRAPEPFYCVMRREEFDAFVTRGVPLTVRYEREGLWATSGRALWRTRAPLARFVVVSALK